MIWRFTIIFFSYLEIYYYIFYELARELSLIHSILFKELLYFYYNLSKKLSQIQQRRAGSHLVYLGFGSVLELFLVHAYGAGCDWATSVVLGLDPSIRLDSGMVIVWPIIDPQRNPKPNRGVFLFQAFLTLRCHFGYLGAHLD